MSGPPDRSPLATNDPSVRQPDGRFAKGNPGGPGNPNNKRTAKMRRVAQEAVTEEMIRGIFIAAVKAALGGDINAAKFVASYVIGAPGAVDEERTAGTEADAVNRMRELYGMPPLKLVKPDGEDK